MSSEQVADTREADARADIYSLGCTLYYLLAGKAPFSGPDFNTLNKKLLAHGQMQAPDIRQSRMDIPPRLVALLNKMLAKSPDKRFPTAKEVAVKLAPFCNGQNLTVLIKETHSVPVPAASAQKIPQDKKPFFFFTALTVMFLGLLLWRLSTWGSVGEVLNDSVLTAEPVSQQTTDSVKAASEKLQGSLTVRELNSITPAHDLPATITNSIEMKLRLIPPGEFLMGSSADERYRQRDEGPQHLVVISRPFYLGAYEVTQREYERVMGSNPSHHQDEFITMASVFGETDRFPVESVTWEDAQKFCKALSDLEAEKQSGRTYRLPTEAEWEYACRAGTNTPYWFGTTIDANQIDLQTASHRDRHETEFTTVTGLFLPGSHRDRNEIEPPVGHILEVGSSLPNPWGLYDVHNNVWEWCSDYYVADYYRSSPQTDPTGPETGQYHVLRGGSGWGSRYDWNRSARRLNGIAAQQLPHSIGFRVVCVVDSESRNTAEK